MLPQQERCLTLLVLAAAGCYATKPSQVKHLKSLDETQYNTNGSMLHGILEGAQKYKDDHQDDSVEPIFKKFESWSRSAVSALKSAGDPKLERLGEDGLDIFRQFHQLYNDLNATTKLKQLNNTQEVDKSKADLQHVADSLKKILHVNDTDYTPKIEKFTKKTSEKINVTEENKKIEIVKRWFLDVMYKFFIGTPNGTDFKNMLRGLLAIATKDLRSLYIAVLVYGDKLNEIFEKTFVARNKEKIKGGRSFGYPPWQQPQNPRQNYQPWQQPQNPRQNYQPSKSNGPPFNWNMGPSGMDGSPFNGRGGDNWMDNIGGDISMGGMGEGFPMGGMDAGSIGDIGFNMGMEDPPDPVPPPPPPPKKGEGEDDNPLDKYDFGDSPKDKKGDANPIQNTPLPPCDASIPAHKKYLDGLANQNQSPANFRPTYTGPQQRPDRVLKIIENQKSSLGQYQPNLGQPQPNYEYGQNGLPFTANASVPRYYRQALPNQTQPIYQVPIRRRKSGSRFTETRW